MPKVYAEAHNPEYFMEMLYGVFTKEFADELAKDYIGGDGEFILEGAGRGTDLLYFDHCFIPVSSDENTVEFKAVVISCHPDSPYDVSFNDDYHYVMKNTENGWRVDRFDLWN